MIFNMRAKEVLGVIESDSTVLKGSYESALKIKKIGGVCVQGENPTPTNPQEIKKSVISVVKTRGKNLLQTNPNRTTSTSTSNGVTYTIDEDGTVTANGTATATSNITIFITVPMIAGRRFNVIQLGGTYTGDLYHVAYDANWAGGKDSSINTASVMSDTINYSRFRLTVKSGAVCNNLKVGFMVSTVDYDTYEPYTESVNTLSQPIDLYGIGDIQDTIEDGKVKRKFRKIVCDGTENWRASGSLVGRYYLENVGGKNYGFVLCSHASGIRGSSTEINVCYVNTTNNPQGRFMLNTEFATVEEWKAHLAEHPMTVVYELAEEAIEDLPLTDQIALSCFKTFHGVTYIEFVSEVQPTLNSDYATNSVGAVALSVHAYNEIEKCYVSYADDGSANFKGNIVNHAYIVGDNIQARQMLFAEALKTWKDIVCQGKITCDNFVIGDNLQANQMVFAQAVEASMNVISKGNVTAANELRGKDLYITNLSVNGGAAQPVEWVWDSVLERYVLCSVQEEA